MENASKALLMAGSILIGILVLSLGVYLYVSFSQEAKNTQELQENQKIVAFNEEYTVYEGREDLTIYDIMTVVNKAKQNNRADYVEGGDIPLITVELDGTELTDKPDSYLEDLLIADLNSINDEGDKLPKYTCEEVGELFRGRISKISFTRN